ncbi:hypothetical protein QTP88_017092 [Uroleucon formosanum]
MGKPDIRAPSRTQSLIRNHRIVNLGFPLAERLKLTTLRWHKIDNQKIRLKNGIAEHTHYYSQIRRRATCGDRGRVKNRTVGEGGRERKRHILVYINTSSILLVIAGLRGRRRHYHHISGNVEICLYVFGGKNNADGDGEWVGGGSRRNHKAAPRLGSVISPGSSVNGENDSGRGGGWP